MKLTKMEYHLKPAKIEHKFFKYAMIHDHSVKSNDDIILVERKNKYIHGLYFDRETEIQNCVETYFDIKGFVISNKLYLDDIKSVVRCNDIEIVLTEEGVLTNHECADITTVGTILKKYFGNRLSDYKDDKCYEYFPVVISAEIRKIF